MCPGTHHVATARVSGTQGPRASDRRLRNSLKIQPASNPSQNPENDAPKVPKVMKTTPVGTPERVRIAKNSHIGNLRKT